MDLGLVVALINDTGIEDMRGFTSVNNVLLLARDRASSLTAFSRLRVHRQRNRLEMGSSTLFSQHAESLRLQTVSFRIFQMLMMSKEEQWMPAKPRSCQSFLNF